MNLQSSFARASISALAVLAIVMSANEKAMALQAHNVPRVTEVASDKGRVEASKEQTLTIQLKLHDREAFDRAVEALYDPTSRSFHKWFSDEDFKKYAPTAAEMKTVRAELERQGLSVVSVDRQNFSIRVHGTTEAAERAFQTELHSYSYNGRTIQAHVRDARLTGVAGDLVDSVVGLDRHAVRPLVTIAKNPKTGLPLGQKEVSANNLSGSLLSSITGTALNRSSELTFNTPGASLPIGAFTGSVYDKNPKLTVSYTPAQLQSYYGLTPLTKQGYDGTGQTIALVEAYGYDQIEVDANLAAKTFGLPALNSSNFEILYPEGKPLNPEAGDLEGWEVEIALDVQAAHAIAPGAKIAVVASSGQDNEDQIASLEYIISNKVANTASSSWENDDEIVSGSAEEDAFNAVLERGAAAGVSFQFSSGDSGDLGLGTPIGVVGVPSNSPWATAVGGTSILNNPVSGGWTTTGWGNNFVYLDEGGLVPLDEFAPPYGGFGGGAGGGESLYFAKPSWQAALPGAGRQVPDVSALADPYTGFSIFVTEPVSAGKTQQYAIAGIGGTSLASPIFTAIWAIADQYNGAPLGFAAPAAAALKPGQINDVLPTSTLDASDVSGTIWDLHSTTKYTPDSLFTGLLYTQTSFVSSLWTLQPGLTIALSFGTDSSLTVTPGWDNVTGYGEPNGLPFIQGVTGKTWGAAIEKQ